MSLGKDTQPQITWWALSQVCSVVLKCFEWSEDTCTVHLPQTDQPCTLGSSSVQMRKNVSVMNQSISVGADLHASSLPPFPQGVSGSLPPEPENSGGMCNDDQMASQGFNVLLLCGIVSLCQMNLLRLFLFTNPIWSPKPTSETLNI